MNNQAIVIYGTTIEKIVSALDSKILEGCNIIGILTDEFTLGISEINGIPIVQIDDINSTVVILDKNIPNGYKKIIENKGLKLWDVDYFLNNINEIYYENNFDDFNYSLEENNDEKFAENLNSENSNCLSDGDNKYCTETSNQNKLYFSDSQAKEISETLTMWLEKIYQAINNTKNKDISIYNINKELQKFKDGYYNKLTSPIILELITLREDYKKSISDFSKFSMNYEKQTSYLECTIDQISEILNVYGVKDADNKYFYNNKIIYPSDDYDATESICFKNEYVEIEKEIDTVIDSTSKIKDFESLNYFLTKTTLDIENLLKNNETLIKCINIQNSDLKEQLALTDGLLIIPLLRKIIIMKLDFSDKLDILKKFKEKAEDIYMETYEYGISYLENILVSFGVYIKNNIDDTYNPKYHRIVKMQKISPEEIEKDKHIATFITDCYVSDERVIAPAKVIVYKI